MDEKNDSRAGLRPSEADRAEWIRPELRRMRAGCAEDGFTNTTPDGIDMS